MADKESDERFSKVFTDPRFRTLRKRDKTLKIDKRFQRMFTEDKFKLKFSMDKRGRSRKHLMSEDYKKFYRLSDDEKEEDEEGEKGDDAVKVEEVEENEDSIEESGEQDADNEEGELKLTHKFGYHRGFKVDDDEDEESSSSSSESEEDEDAVDEEEELEHDWGELDREAQPIEGATARLAVCNADWDRINAQDLFVLLNSFKKATGIIHNVRIYYSKFGEERMHVEEKKGPSEFIFGKTQLVETLEDGENGLEDSATKRMGKVKNLDELYQVEEEEEEDEASDPKARERLRKYQLERLKYFYAVVECDSAQTAEVIYQELDGMEYEASSTMLDIRFVPDQMDFDDVRLKEECTSMPNSTMYKPPEFINTALQQSKVRLTWDETDPRRKEAFNRAFEEDNEDDIQAYLASSSDEEQSDIEIDHQMEESDKINKYKDLLKSLDQNKEEYEMEVTWDPSLRANTEDLIKNKDSNTAEVKKKTSNKITEELSESDEEDEDLDDEISEVDNDEQLSDDKLIDVVPEDKLTNNNETKSKRKKWKNKMKNQKADQLESEDTSNLELLMLDIDKSGENKKHFNYRHIVDTYNKKKGDEDESTDGFKFNPNDPRFSSIYTSHLYNIDQSDPNFKRTKAFDQILNKRKEKAARLVCDEGSEVREHGESSRVATSSKTWNTLVRKVKDKTNEQLARKRPTPFNTTNSRFDTNKKFRR